MPGKRRTVQIVYPQRGQDASVFFGDSVCRVCVGACVCSCVCVGVRAYVCMCVRAEGVKEKYVWADLPGLCGSVVLAECLPHVMRERERENKLQR